MNDDKNRLNRFEGFIESVKRNRKQKFTINNLAKGAKQEARDGIFSKKRKGKEKGTEATKEKKLINNGFDGYRKEEL